MKHQTVLWIIGFTLLSLVFIVLPLSNAANIVGGNYKNVTVQTSVNITNSKPEILSIAVYQETNVSQLNITLNAGLTRTVTCNATVRDWNTYTDISGVNATLFQVGVSGWNETDDNNTHYSNTSCTNLGDGAGYLVGYQCAFNVYYYANNATWNCTLFAYDSLNSTGNRSNTTYLYSLYALNVTDGINFGGVAVEDYSGNVTANITNFGNKAVNITVEGYGVTRGDGLAMNCSLGGNITVENERFSLADVVWGSKTVLSASAQLLDGLTIPKQTDPGTPQVNTTYWQLYVSSVNVPGGNCTGYVIFSAEIP